ncbi:fused MFS/spermidine synthase [Hydrogenophaga taeniospiralis]|nr:fused MFS/spermidine synthase [Hydrogenophaga taeniospiralis]
MSTTRSLYILFFVAFILELLSFAELAPSIHGLVYESMVGQRSNAFWAASLIGGWFFLLLCISDSKEQKIKTTIAGLFLAVFLLYHQKSIDRWSVMGSVLTGLGLVGFIRLVFNASTAPNAQSRLHARSLAIEAALIPCFVLISGAALSLTTALRPYTYDLISYRLDLILVGKGWITALVVFVQSMPLLDTMLRIVYLLLPLFMLWIRFEQHRSRNIFHVNAINAFMYVAAFGYVLYLIVPVSGPIYTFGQYFPNALPAIDQIPALLAPTLALAPRNGIPSLHMAWGMMVFLCSLSLKPVHIFIAALLMILTAISTLAFGEHYLIDILIAVPFAFAMYLVAHFSETKRMDKPLLALCTITLLVMLFAVIGWPSITEQNYFYTFAIFLVLPILCAYKFAYSIKTLLPRFPIQNVSVVSERMEKVAEVVTYERKVFALFILSGFAALVYQVLFAKKLGLIFGSAAIATYTVLATYMAGIALGSVVGGWLGQRVSLKIKTYAVIELLIAIYCLISPLLFTLIHITYASVAGNISPDASIMSFYRVMLGGVVLLIPTLAMGMTTPLLVAAVTRNKGLGDSVGLLYGANTLGAAAGALLTGYLILPVLGIQKTLLTAVALNLLAGGIALQLQKKYSSITDAVSQEVTSRNTDLSSVLPVKYNAIFLLLFLTGFVTLSLETFYIQLLAVVAGNSAYAFSLMLFTFLLGLSCGAMTCRWLINRVALDSAAYVFCGLIMVALAILLGNYGWDSLPGYFLSFENHPYARSFASREVVRGIVCFIMMFPVAYAIGFMYPASMDIVGKRYPNSQAVTFGIGSAVNTLGNILGVVIGGFILLPALGAFSSLLVAAGLVAACALFVAVYLLPRTSLQYTLPAIAITAFAYLIQPSGFNMTQLASGANVYFSSQHYGEVIDHSESIDGGLTTVSILGNVDNPTLTLLTNGKFQGDNSKEREMAAQVGFALAPLLHQTQRESALVIGYGTGVSARSISDAGFGKVEIVELSSDIFTMADKYFHDVNDNVRTRSSTKSFVTDGRNFLFLHEKKYDLISMEISSIWFAGAANLYNAEFYDLARMRLKDDGVFQQWVQMHRISEMDIVTVLATVRSRFQYVWLYYIGGQGIIVATNDPLKRPSHESIALLNQTETLKSLLGFYGGRSENILGNRLLDPQAVDGMLSTIAAGQKISLSTDDNLTLEYTTPKGNVRAYQSSIKQNLEFLSRFRPGPEELNRGTLISSNKTK